VADGDAATFVWSFRSIPDRRFGPTAWTGKIYALWAAIWYAWRGKLQIVVDRLQMHIGAFVSVWPVIRETDGTLKMARTGIRRSVPVGAEPRIRRYRRVLEGDAFAFAQQWRHDKCCDDENLHDDGNGECAALSPAGTAFLLRVTFDEAVF
jgi:hypothetical protein